MMKRITLSLLVLLLAACGKNTDDYVGVWQRDEDDKLLRFIEIKKESDNYLFLQGKKQFSLSENNGELILNTGFGEIPFQLSEDRKTLLANLFQGGSNRFLKVEDEPCKQLAIELQTFDGVSLMFDKESRAKRDAISEKYLAQCKK